MAFIGTLVTNLKVKTASFTKGMRKGKRGLSSFSKSVQSTNRMLKGLAAAMAGFFALRALKRFVTDALKTIDVTAKVSDKLGIATEKLIGLRRAAKLTGVATVTLDMALQRMVRRVSEAAMGTGEAQSALKALGVDAQKLNAMTVDQQFSTLAEAMSKVTSQSDKVRLSFKLFDSEGVALVNTLSLGADGLARVQKESEQLGSTFDRIEAAKVEAANDAFATMGEKLQGLSNTLAIGLAPTLEAAAEKLTAMGGDGDEMAVKVMGAIKGITKAVALLADTIKVVQIGWKTMQVIASAALLPLATYIGTLAKAVDAIQFALTGKRNEIATTIAMIPSALIDNIKKVDKEIDDLVSAESYGDQVERTFAEIEAAAALAAQAVVDGAQDGASGWQDMTEQIKAVAAEMKKVEQAAMRVFEGTRTPLEQYEKKIGELGKLMAKGLIDKDTYARGLQQARIALDRWVESNKEKVGGGRGLAKMIVGSGVSATALSIPATDPRRDTDKQILDVDKKHLEVARQLLQEVKGGKRGGLTGTLGGAV